MSQEAPLGRDRAIGLASADTKLTFSSRRTRVCGGTQTFLYVDLARADACGGVSAASILSVPERAEDTARLGLSSRLGKLCGCTSSGS